LQQPPAQDALPFRRTINKKLVPAPSKIPTNFSNFPALNLFFCRFNSDTQNFGSTLGDDFCLLFGDAHITQPVRVGKGIKGYCRHGETSFLQKLTKVSPSQRSSHRFANPGALEYPEFACCKTFAYPETHDWRTGGLGRSGAAAPASVAF
jgi:hypothetical protein